MVRQSGETLRVAGADRLGGRGALSFEQQFRHGLAGDEAVDQPAAHRALHGAQAGDGHGEADHRLFGRLVQRHAQHAVIGQAPDQDALRIEGCAILCRRKPRSEAPPDGLGRRWRAFGGR